MRDADSQRATRDRPGADARSSKEPWRWRSWLLWTLGIALAAAVIAQQYASDHAEDVVRNGRHASLLAQDVWDLDADSAMRSLQVMADAGQYELISVVLPDGRTFARLERPSGRSHGGPLSTVEMETPIRRDGEVLATLHTHRHDHRAVYYALEAVVLLLLGLLVQLAAQNFVHRRDLERLRLHDEITLREEVEARLKQREGELRRAQRLEALGQVAGGVAHDFNNLLTVIIGRIEMARLGSDDKSRHDLELALEAADRAQAMTHRLLAFESGHVPKPSNLDLDEVVRGILDMLRHLLPANVKLETELGAQGMPVRADRGQLGQVILNLVVNARDALSSGGTIRIRTGQRTDERGHSRVFLEVQDDGMGMTDDVKRRVFEPFFTTKGAGGGTGLGLATVARIVEQSQATLALESTPGQGTTVNISFGEAKHEGDQGDGASAAVPPKARVLVVEDDPSLRLFVREALEGCGVEVTTARDPEDALRILKLAPTAVDLVLSDVVMPHMSGPVLRDQARQWRVNVPFVFMTGASARDGLENEAILQKPFTTADVRSAVRSRLPASDGARTG